MRKSSKPPVAKYLLQDALSYRDWPTGTSTARADTTRTVRRCPKWPEYWPSTASRPFCPRLSQAASLAETDLDEPALPIDGGAVAFELPLDHRYGQLAEC